MKKLFQVIKDSIVSGFQTTLGDESITKYQVDRANRNYVSSTFKTLLLVCVLFFVAQVYYVISDAITGNFAGDKFFGEYYILDLIGEVIILAASFVTIIIVAKTISNNSESSQSFESRMIAFFYITATIGCCLFVTAKILRCGGIINTHSSIIYIVLLLSVVPPLSNGLNITCFVILGLTIIVPGSIVLGNPSLVSNQDYLEIAEITTVGWIINNIIFIILGVVVTMFSRATTMRSKLKSIILLDRNVELKQRTETDELTQVSNRLAMKRFIESKEDEWRSLHEGVAFLMLDIDFFKKYNDFYGHLRGDECLRRVAQAANLVAQQYNGCVYRYGGEEFVIIAEHIDEAQALTLAKEVHKEIGKLKIPHEGINGDKEVMLTVSIGLNLETSFKRASSQWILDADLQLYYAKHEGRNCTAFRNGLYNTYHKPAAGEEAKITL